MSITTTQETMAESLYGMTKERAHSKKICLNCREPALPRCYSEAGKKEYQISGLCEECFDKLCGG